MENNQITDDSVEMTVESAKEQALFFDAMIRLENNPDFKKVILDEYITNEPVRLSGILGLPAETAGTDKEDTIADIEAIGRFRYWMKNVRERTGLIKAELDEYISAIENKEED
jgi:hypothetical protein